MNAKRWIPHLRDMGVNTIAFGLYIGFQQLVIMPTLSNMSDAATYSGIIIFLSIFHMTCSVIGEELGNTRMLRRKQYEQRGLKGDFHLILLLLILVSAAGLLIVGSAAGVSAPDLLGYLLIGAMGICRFFSMAGFKMKLRFGYVLYSNLCYLIGALPGLLIARKTEWFLAPFFSGELLASAFVVLTVLRHWEWDVSFKRTPELQNTASMYLRLAAVAIIMNLMLYLDRLIIYPVLGAYAMAVYYAASTTSKLVLSVLNPVSGVILARLSSNGDDRQKRPALLTAKPFLLVFMVFTLCGFLSSYLGVRILYPAYLREALPLLGPIAAATSFGGVSSLLKPLILRFYHMNQFLISNLAYAAVFLVLMLVFSGWWGILGFAYASAAARTLQFASYYFIILRGRSRTDLCTKETHDMETGL